MFANIGPWLAAGLVLGVVLGYFLRRWVSLSRHASVEQKVKEGLEEAEAKAKEVVLNFVLDNEDNFVVEYTKQGNPKPGSYDRADSYIIAKAGWKNLNS